MVLKLSVDGTFRRAGYGKQMVWWRMTACEDFEGYWVWDPWFLGYFR